MHQPRAVSQTTLVSPVSTWSDGDLHVELTLLAGQMRGVVLETGHRDHRAKSECPRHGTL